MKRSDHYFSVISPVWKQIWIMFDQSNGHSKGSTYFWVFGTKREALEHRRKVHKLKDSVKLSYPQKIKE